MLSSVAGSAGTRGAVVSLSPVGSLSALLFVMCIIVVYYAGFVKSFSKNFGTKHVKRVRGAGS